MENSTESRGGVYPKIASDFAEESLFDIGNQLVGLDSRTNPFEEGENDRVEPDSEHEDKLHISTGPVTRARAKKLEQALQNLWTHIREEARSSKDEQVDSGLILVIKSAGPHQYTSGH
ncbi:uncharacterized protein LOC116215682 isoform X2 [Punica granatum]|uniref:Uncharacterized protein LOC116215682 isoform X2 n=1 Tax=Punica granatum TaxID=22663 RepID=A0A6P8EBG5_PUNGR|nr:uncharacterized protein LOC116215682 isoform X2 [Punica granatum]